MKEDAVAMETKNFELLEIKATDNDPGFFSGYASTFGGRPDFGGDIIEQGAFTESLAKGGKFGYVPMLFDHDSSKVVGIWTRHEEDVRGLSVDGRLAIDTSLGKDLYSLLRMKAIRTMSIGYEVFDRKYDEHVVRENNGVRRLKKLDLWEISIVPMPMNARAKITDVKSAIEKAQNVREMEHALREIGLSCNAAKYLAGLTRPGLDQGREADKGLRGVLDSLKELNQDLAVSMVVSNAENAGDGILKQLKSVNATFSGGK